MSGLRVELAIDSPTGCPVAQASSGSAGAAMDATWSSDGRRTTEQFELAAPMAEAPDGVEAVFEHEDGVVYEFERSTEGCACERIEAAGLPIADVRAEDGQLRVTLHVDDEVDLVDVLDGVREVASDVSVRSIARSVPEDGRRSDLVLVDRGRLTERQFEVLETARTMGYYEYPRGANASEVADALDICASTLSEHLAAAQTKLLDGVFGDQP